MIYMIYNESIYHFCWSHIFDGEIADLLMVKLVKSRDLPAIFWHAAPAREACSWSPSKRESFWAAGEILRNWSFFWWFVAGKSREIWENHGTSFEIWSNLWFFKDTRCLFKNARHGDSDALWVPFIYKWPTMGIPDRLLSAMTEAQFGTRGPLQ